MSRGLAAKVSHSTIEGAVAGAVSLDEVPRSCAAQDCGDRSRAFPALEMGGEEGVVAREELVEDRIGFVAIGLDVDEQDGYPAGRTINNSTDTYGFGYKGKVFDTVTLAATYASQSDGGDSSLNYDTDYYMAEAGITFAGVTIKGGYEVLASDGGVGFQTPYATLHKFQGWADKFLVTPGAGIEDAYISLGGKLGPVRLGAIYHDFQAESSSEDWGSEIDLVATWPVLSYLTLQAKYADFNSDSDSYQDTKKLWLTLQLKL